VKFDTYKGDPWFGYGQDPITDAVLAALEDQETIIKDDAAVRLWRSSLGLYVKCYLSKARRGLIGRLRMSRAQRAYRNAKILQERGFGTANGLAALHHKSRPGQSYLVMEEARGQALEGLLIADKLDPSLLIAWLASFHQAGLYHRDLKRANLFVDGPSIIAIDLDSLVVDPYRCDYHAGKDLGMLLSSAGAFFSQHQLGRFLLSYQRQRGLSKARLRRILKRSLNVASQRFHRGSAPDKGGWGA
jgi:tRNA A-37 threonylcarbamoyl transferase component Bud32